MTDNTISPTSQTPDSVLKGKLEQLIPEAFKVGLEDLRQFIIDNEIKSNVIPALGAGNGGLN